MRTGRGLTLLEVVVVIAMMGILVSLIVPQMGYTHTCSRRTQCASNIRQLLTAMYLYSDSPNNLGRMPTFARTKDDPFENTQSGCAALGMLYRQYVNDPRIFACPSDPLKPVFQHRSSIIAADSSHAFDWILKPSECSYGYDPGHSTEISSMVALLSDKSGANGNSDNHGRNAGQNVGFGTSVEFRERVTNPLERGAADNNIFTVGDVTAGAGGPVTRDEDSFIRQ